MSTCICKIHPNYGFNSIKTFHNKGEYSLIKLTVNSKTEAYLTVSQLNQRWVWRNENYEASLCKFIFAKYDPTKENPYEFINATCWLDEDTTLDSHLELEPGEYIAYIEIDWFNDQKFNNFVFKSYSDNHIDLKVEDPHSHQEILENMLKSCAVKNSKRKDYTEKGHKDIFRCFSVTDSKCEYGFLYY